VKVVHAICEPVIMKNTQKKVEVKTSVCQHCCLQCPNESLDYCKHVLQPVKGALKRHTDFSQRDNLLIMWASLDSASTWQAARFCCLWMGEWRRKQQCL